MLAIQVTVFPYTGICIGLTRHHSACDGRGFTHFMRTWASISKLGAGFGSLSPDQSLPILDRTMIKEQDDMLKMFLDKLDGFMGSESVSRNRILRMMDVELQPNMVRATFQLNEASGSPQFGNYKTDFGFGRPKKVEVTSIDRTGAMCLKDSSNVDGGIEFDLVLNREEMDAWLYFCVG
ncbi:malonyl-coenzyme:anthocyanin 5-O-glucoside-6'''-O-malonyltransferase-like [Macadamia integrifolia]|uniref:malonyl-coenzyme:anthocyanin 5-O-glucoside-6'''-O-malonyltransferase-like n=1 Tax=Macadamia integrifolia TaxID=60698 RepID=UPI001C527876|nr:malonyl-coenzyme:anthocyanin 5-O-glucoside-6'''-O-malonyltransferase-like [Macadamia integrifolia]